MRLFLFNWLPEQSWTNSWLPYDDLNAILQGKCRYTKVNFAYLAKAIIPMASQVELVVKNPLAKAGDVRDVSSIPGSRRSPLGGHGNPLQYSCLENPMDRVAWQRIVHGVAKNQIQLKQVTTHAHTRIQLQEY